AFDGMSAVAAVSRRPPAAVLVLGDELPRLGVVPLVQQIRRRWPSVQVVIVGDVAAPEALVLPFGCTTEAVVEALGSPPAQGGRETASSGGEGMTALTDLTRRQRVVLRLLVDGRGMREIADELGVSEHTVRTHMQNLYSKLGCHSRLELVHFAVRRGLVSDDSENASG
nr:response regulator transcription factor [Actinomycetota bacterium]